MINDGVTGLLGKPGRPDELAQSIVAILRNDDPRHRTDQTGRHWVKTYFRVDRMARQSVDLYAAAIEGKPCQIR
jgi:glycosyltransferase involved in cell wall biosynthesis